MSIPKYVTGVKECSQQRCSFNDEEVIYLARGCLWGVQEFLRHLPGVTNTEAGRANGTANTTQAPYDGYAECIKVDYDPHILTLEQLIDYFFEIIDPYSINKQGDDVGEKYRTGIYSTEINILERTKAHLTQRDDHAKLKLEVLPLTNYVRSDDEHQDRLTRCPEDYCHIPLDLLYKYKNPANKG